MGERLKREGTSVCLWLIHVDVWQKPTQYCKAIILQLKINKLKKMFLRSSHMLVWGGCSITQPLWKTVRHFLPDDPAFSAEMKACPHKDWCSSFICHSEEFKCPSTDGRICKSMCACTPAERTNWIHRSAWRICKITRGQMRRSHYCAVAFIWNSGKCTVVYRDRKGALPCVAGWARWNGAQEGKRKL